MKICFLTTSFARFPDDPFNIYIYRLALSLAENGTEVTVVAPGDHNTKNREIFNGILIDRFNYFPIKKLQKLAYGKSGIPDNLKSSYLAWLQIPFFLISFFLKASKACRHCDVIHAHWLPSALVAVLANVNLRKPIVLTEHNANLRHYPGGLIKPLLSAVDVITTAHPEIKDRIKKRVKKDVIEIPNMIDTVKFVKAKDLSPIKKEFNVGDEKVVTFIGRLVPWKGVITLLKTIPLILKKRDDIRFLIVGQGELLDPMQDQVMKNGYEKSVIFTGPRKDISRILSISDIFLALSNIENIWSTTIIEAMILEVPCIITKAGYTEKVLKHKKNCYMVEKENPKDLAKTIELLLAQSDARDYIASNAKHFITVEKGYQKDIILKKYMNIYNQLVS
tara:strand:- start:130 stop:1305 length:1176 start_codon:yes stop_codon:yes gene_type:complete